jgi:CSLREA domain-containing protein
MAAPSNRPPSLIYRTVSALWRRAGSVSTTCVSGWPQRSTNANDILNRIDAGRVSDPPADAGGTDLIAHRSPAYCRLPTASCSSAGRARLSLLIALCAVFLALSVSVVSSSSSGLSPFSANEEIRWPDAFSRIFGHRLAPAKSVAATPLSAPEPFFFAARTWNNTGTDFNTTGNWTGGTPGTGDVGLFSTTGPGTQPNLSANLTIAGLRFTAATSGYDITNSGGAVLTLNAVNTTGSGGTTTAASAAIRNDNTTGTTQIDAPLNLAPSTLVSTIFQEGADGSTLILNGAIGQTGTVALSLKNGTIQLNNGNSFSSSSIDAAGTILVLGNNSALGAGTLTINNTSTLQAGGGARSLSNAIVLGGDTTLSGSNAFTFNGSVTSSVSASRALTVSNTGGATLAGNVFLAATNVAGGLTVSGSSAAAISGVITNNSGANSAAGTLTYSGSNTLTLSNTNTYTGATNINAGILALTGSGSIANSSFINVFGGATFDVSGLGSTLTLGNAQALEGLGTTVSSGTIKAATSGLTMGSTSPLNLNYTNGIPTLNVTGGAFTLQVGNHVTVSTASALAAGDYTLISSSSGGSVGGTAPTSLTVTGNSLAAGTTGTLQITGSQLVLHVVAVVKQFRSKSPGGSWTDTTTWEQSTDGGLNWVAATSTPTFADDTITIRNGHTVTILSDVTTDQTTIELGGTVIVASGVTFTINDGAGVDLAENGELRLNGGSPNAVLAGQSPTYGSGSLLNYNGGSRTQGVEWNATPGSGTPGLGQPFHVNANGNLNPTPATTRSVAGNLTLSAALILGGDLNLYGNFTNNLGSYTANGHTLTFLGSSTQTWSDNQSQNFGAVVLNGSGLQLSSAINVTNFTLTAGTLNLNSNNLSVSGNWANSGSLTPSTGTVTFNGNNNTQTLSGSSTFNNLTINHTGTGGVTAAGSTLNVTGLFHLVSGSFTSATQYADVTIDSGTTLVLSGDINVSGNWTNNGTFTPSGFTVTFNGTGAQTITTGGTGAGKPFAGFTVSKSSGTATLAGDLSDTALTITSGTFDQGASFSVSTGAVNITAGTWSNTGTGDLTLSGDVSNAGTITFNANGTGCPDADDIAITSTVGQRAWSGAGTFNLTDVAVSNQGGTALITVHSGTNVIGNGLTWIFIAGCSGGEYTWTPAVLATDWQVPTNWTPTRVTPDPGDVLIFDNNSTPIVTNIPTQTISKLRIIGTTAPSFSAASNPSTLTINAGAGVTGFDVFGLAVTGSNALVIKLGSGTLGTVTNFMSLADGAHKLISNDAGGITFPGPAIFSTQAGFTGNAFGDGSAGNGAAGSVIFQSGASYIHNAGSSPFGAAGNASVVTFQTGSEADWLTSAGFQASGRTYANLVIGQLDPGGVAANVSDTGTGNFQFDNLTINAEGTNNSSLSFTGTGSSTTTIKGNITSNGVGTGTFQDVTLIAPGGVTIDKSGTILFNNDGSNARGINLDGNVTLTSGTTLTLSRIVLLGMSNPNSKTLTVTSGATLNAGPSGYVVGSLRRTFAAAGPQTFEVGTLNGYSPVDVNATAGTFPAVFTASASATQEPHIHGVTVNALKRYWTLSEDSGSVTAVLVFHYVDPTDIPTNINPSFTDANYILFKYDGSFSRPAATVDTNLNTATITGVSSFSNWTLADPNAVQEGSLQFSAATYTPGEGAGSLLVTVTRTGGVDGAVSVAYGTSSGTATAGSDFTTTSGVLNWADNDATDQTFSIPITNDTLYEGNEDFTVALSSPTGGAALGANNPATITIVDNDTAPTFAIGNVTQVETDSGTTNFVFTVTKTGSTALDSVITYSTNDGTAMAPSDFTAVTGGTITILAADPSGTITISVNGDTTVEPDETFTVDGTNVTNGSFSDASGLGTITNDDTAAPEIDVKGNGLSIADGDITPSLAKGTDFGSAAVSAGNVSNSFTIENTGGADLNLTGTAPNYVTISGPDAADFTVTLQPTTPVSNGSPTTFTIQFIPSASGPRNATVNIANDDSDESLYDFAITGTGTCQTLFTVTSLGDEPDSNLADGLCDTGGTCTLRAAIMQANALVGCGLITIDATSQSGTIALGAALPAIDHDVNINGPGANLLTVQRSILSDFGVFTINSGKTVTISGLTISGGSVFASNGGGIYNGGTLTLTNSTVSGNTASGGGSGGGIYNGGTLTLTNSTISGNTASVGGGIFGEGGALTLTNSTLSGNTASSFGGGIELENGTLTLTNSTVSGNTSGSDGGGINLGSGSTGTSRNTLIAGNSASGSGPDVFNFLNSFTSQGHNLIGIGDGSAGFTGTGDQVGTGALPIDPRLGPLQNNGGPTSTHALLAGSPALDAGDDCVFDDSCSPALGVALTEDQRGAGFSRKIDGNGDSTETVDIGAFEAQTVLFPTSLFVTKIADTDNTCLPGDCSLREAIKAANSDPDTNTITFAIPGGGPDVIVLGLGPLAITQSVNINGPTAKATTVDGNNATRIFAVGAGTVSISNLTIANARTNGGGGGIRNVASLTLINVTVSGNSGRGGGGIANSGTGTLNVINSTISGNGSDTDGGGIFNAGGATLSLLNATIANNTADQDNTDDGDGGGVFNANGAAGAFSARNSIIASNIDIGGEFPDVAGNLDSLGHNLIGVGDGSPGLTDDPTCSSLCDKVGTVAAPIDPKLGPLANNGGPTFTHALLAGSPALDAGDDCVFDDSCIPALGVALTTDQRGAGYSRQIDGNGDTTPTVDIGAFEAQTVLIPTGSIQFSAANYIVSEDGVNAVITVTRTGGSNGLVSATFSTANGSATAGSDYTAVSQSVSFADGVTTDQTVNVPITNDATAEGYETVLLSLTNPTGGATLGSPANATLTITDNDTASSVIVNTLDDLDLGACLPSPGHCSLREAVKYAPAGSHVLFSVTGTIVTLTQILFNQSINIDGPGVNLIIVSGNGGPDNHRVFRLPAGYTVTINRLTIANGREPFDVGGGIYNNGGTLTVSDCVIRNNFAEYGGSGVFINGDSTTTFNRCTFNDNNGGNSGSGGAVSANGTATAIVNINNCTFNNNHARDGGALALGGGAMNVNSATITGNSAGFCDGNGCTDSAGGFRISDGKTATINNTIIAGNTIAPGLTSSDLGGTVASGDYNLIQNAGGWSFASGGTHNITGQDPLLGPLQDNGGPTPTMALLANSPAIDQGNAFGLTTDQRGFVRPTDDQSIANADGGDGSDIGAYEFGAATPPTADLSITKVDSQDPVTQGNNFTYTITVANSGPQGATNVVMDDPLPAGVTFVSATPSQGSCTGTATVNCTLGTIASAANATVLITVTATQTGLQSNTATATATATESDPTTPNTATETTQVNAAVCTLPPPTGMVAWYPGDGNADDIQGPTFENGGLQGGVTYAAGKVDQAFSFDGVNGKVVVPPNSNLDFTQALTIDAWVRPTATNEAGVYEIVNKYRALGPADRSYRLFIANKKLGFSSSSCSVNSVGDVAFGQWNHVAVTFDDADQCRLYINGQPDASAGATGPIPNVLLQPLTIGAFADQDNGDTAFFKGQIDEVELFGTALAATNIAAIYNASFAGKCRTCTTPPPDMVSWWDGSGSVTTANDIQGTNNGTLQDNATFAPGKVGQGFSLDGVNDYVFVPNSPSLNITGNQVTIDGWINPSLAMSNEAWFFGKIGDGATQYALQWEAGVIVGRVGNTAIAGTTPFTPPANTWTHLALVYDGASNPSVTIYVNGSVYKTSATPTGNIPSTSSDFFIGAFSDGARNFAGLVDEVEIFSRALSQPEIAAIADAGNAGKCHTSTIQFDSATYSVTEGNTNKTITVTRTGAHDTSTSFHYASSAGSATPGAAADYDDVFGDLTFDPGQVTKTFDVPIHEDNIFEGDETVSLTLSNVTGGATLGSPSSATLTINDNDSAPNITIDDVTQAEGSGGGTTPFIFTVSLSNPSATDVNVNFTTADNTAKQPGDYATNSSVLLIPANSTSGQITVLVAADDTLEPSETFFVNLTGATGGTITDSQGIGTIQNDDAGPTFTITDVTLAEGDVGQTSFVFTVTKTGATAERARVDFATANGTTNPATGGGSCGGLVDYISQGGTLSFRPTDPNTQTITVPVCGNTTLEPDETFFIDLSNPVNASISDSQGVGTILNDDCTLPPVNMVSWWPAENNANDIAGPNSGTFAANTYAPGKVGQAFNFDGVDDFVSIPAFPATSFQSGTTLDLWFNSASFSGSYNDIVSTFSEGGPGWTLYYFNGTLRFYDGAGDVLASSVVPQTNQWYHVAVVRSGDTYTMYLNGSVVSTGVSSHNNIAAPMRFSGRSDGTGLYSGLIDEVEIFSRALSQPEIQNLSDASGAGKCRTSTIQFAQANTDSVETDSGSHTVNIVVTRNGDLTGAADVTYTVTDGTAQTADGDYSISPASGTLHWNSGDGTPQNIVITVFGDTTSEADETVILTLSNVSGATLGTPNPATLTITNDDAAPTVTIGNRTANEGTLPAGTTAFTFTVTRTGSTGLASTVSFATADDTGGANPATSGASCTAGVDYISQSGIVSFPDSGPGSTSQPITILVCRDPDYEANETFLVNLSSPTTNATLGTPSQGVGTISNDDSPAGGFVVNTTNDLDDGVCNVAHCSLREAINAANGSGSAAGISFAIPAGDPRHFYYSNDGVVGQVTNDGSHVLPTSAVDDTTIVGIDPDWPHSWWSILPTAVLPTATQSVVIDGYTQTGATANTLTASDNAVLKIELDGASAGAGSTGMRIAGGGSILRGVVINRFSSHGVNLQSSPGSTVTGNFIGTDVSGTLGVGLSNAGSGVSCASNSMTIGGSSPALVNLISGNVGDGILLSNSNSNLILGNFIGTKADGTTLLPNGASGINVAGGSSVFSTIGGINAGEGNTIGFNTRDGVRLADSGQGNAIRGNSIFANGSTASDLGIDLGADGITLNDDKDPDSGPNTLQNFPIITSALVTGSTRTITGTLNSTVGASFTIDFYQNTSCDTSGNGEGKTYLGSTSVVTDGTTGDVSFTFHPLVLTIGQQVTATATSDVGVNTSEFSTCFTVLNGDPGAGDIQFTSATYSVAENVPGGLAAITLTRVGGTNGSISATFTTSDGTAQQPGDYTTVNQVVTFGEGVSSMTVNVPVIDDTRPEANETVNLALGSTSINAARGDDSILVQVVNPHAAVLTIIDNDPCPTTFTVNSNLDTSDADAGDGLCATSGGVCTLRAAIEEANALTACGTIDINFSIGPATITLGGSELTVNHNVNINGPTLSSVIISGNNASRVFTVNSGKTVAISSLTISGGNGSGSSGGGIVNIGTLTLTNITVSGNAVPSGFRGGGIENGGVLTVTNSTLSGNTTSYAGGAIDNGGASSVVLTNSTVTGNAAQFGGGIINAGTVSVRNTIIGGNSASVSGPDISGSFTTLGNNLIGKSDGGSGFTNGVNGDIVGTVASPVDPLLGALMNNGGPTFTHGLLYNSPAVDAGNDVVSVSPLFLTTDQRGLARQSDGHSDGIVHVDIGAYERQHTESRPVPLGSNVHVDLNDVRLAFPTVSGTRRDDGAANGVQPSGGNSVSITVIPVPGDAPPSSFAAFDVTPSSAFYTPPVDVCFYLPSITPKATFDNLKIYHRESGVLADHGTYVNFASRIACTEVTSFSDFVIGFGAFPSVANGTIGGKITDSNGAPLAGTTINLGGTQTRETITDSQGKYSFDSVETNGFYTVTPTRANYTFNPANRSFSALGVHTEASFTAAGNGDHANAIDTTEFFVRQQYLDFLGREPDPPGFNGWVNTLRNCAPGDASCDRIHISEAFFRSQEFQERGYFVYRFYSSAFGRKPDYSEFTPDLGRVSGFLTNAQLETAKTTFVNDFMTRPAFAAQYNSLSNAAYVDALINTAAVNLANRQALVDGLSAGTLTRAQVLRQIAESAEVYQKNYNQAFVVMEYFGYLRRDPDALYLDWIQVLDANPADSRHMVNGFVNSLEYRNRFAQ